MAIAFDAATDGGSVNPGTSLTWSHTCTGADRILWVGVLGNLGTDSVTGITYNGVAMSRVEAIQEFSGTRYNYLYVLVNPASGSNSVVVSSASSYINGLSVSYAGAAQAGQPDAHTSQTGGPVNSMTTSVTTIADNCWTVLWGRGNGDLGAGSGSTERVESSINQVAFYDSNGVVTPPGSKSMTHTMGTSSFMAACMASFAPVVAAASGGPSQRPQGRPFPFSPGSARQR